MATLGQGGIEGEGSGEQPQGTFRSRMESRLDVLTAQVEPIGELAHQLGDLNVLVRTFIAAAPTQQQLKDAVEERVRRDVFEVVLKGVNARLERLEGSFARMAPWFSIGLAAISVLIALVAILRR
jgi:hypothetical protein